jgi:hypothetical protein
MESNVREQEKKGEDDLILFGLDFPDATFIKVDAPCRTACRPTWKCRSKGSD